VINFHNRVPKHDYNNKLIDADKYIKSIHKDHLKKNGILLDQYHINKWKHNKLALT
jgi:hypothetical protein